MACLWVLVALLSTVSGRVLRQDEDSAPCEPGAVWVMEDGCNSCFCLMNGQPACSFMDCSAPDQQSSPGVYKPLPEPEPEGTERRSGLNCTEGDTWLERCNWCSCLADGEAVCSRMGCDDSEAAPAEAARSLCTPGEIVSAHGCEQCFCVDHGQVICVLGSCRMDGGSRRRRRRQAGCTPGTSRQVDCNTCMCLQNGLEACTRRFCLPDPPSAAPEPAKPAGSRTGSRTGFGSGSGSGCSTQVCPADCGSSRDAQGCLVCSCGPDPFFSPPPSQPAFTAFQKHPPTLGGWIHLG